MLNLPLSSLMWIFCILSNFSQVIITVFHQKIRNKLQFKYYSGLFFANLILTAGLLSVLILLSQDNAVLVFGILEIVVLQIFLVVYVKKIRQQSPNLSIICFSILLFGTLRIFGEYYFFQNIILEVFLEKLSLYSFIYFEFFFIFSISLICFFILWVLIRIFSIKAKFQTSSAFIWASICIFAITFFIDLILFNLGVTPAFIIDIWPFIGHRISIITYGTVFQYVFLTSIMILAVIILGYKRRFELFSKNNFKLLDWLKIITRIGLGTAIALGILYILFNLAQFTHTIIEEITKMFEYNLFFLTHPYWFLGIAYLILLIIPMYIGYLTYTVIRKRKNLWDQPNAFNITPMINLILLVFSGFIVCYYELVPPIPRGVFWIERSFILFVIIFYLSAFLALLILYLLTFHRKHWVKLSYSFKVLIFYLPFVIGYLISGQILTVTEFIMGLMACTALQLCMLYLRRLNNNSSFGEKKLIWFIALFWGVLATIFAGLLSITALISIFVGIVLVYAIYYLLEPKNIKIVIYGVILGCLLIMGGTSQTFLTNPIAYGFPNTLILNLAFGVVILSIIYYGLKKYLF